ncbi:probable cytochrome P450 305a1 [Neocloeon triangulifer]|uniref:probable cytochrome P450 305a1 n=1 Tax=Neocloeon triangulifer TaxID=2078957 RepID=UPI00286F5CE1|nr:probable cytochrome P450 305a1 [Neocloeon triangulifer]
MITLVLVCIALLLLILYAPLKPKNFPPGPPWLPFVGCAPQLKSLTKKLGFQHNVFLWLSERFKSPVVGLRLGSQSVVAVSGYHAVKQIFTREEFEGRPDTFFIRMRSMGTRKGITCTDGAHWQEQRSFAVRHLRSLGFGKSTMECMIRDEVSRAISQFDQNIGEPAFVDFAQGVMSVLWELTAGTKFSDDDPSLGRLLELMKRRARSFDMSGGVLSQFPWLRFVAPDSSGFNLLNTVNSELNAFFMETIRSHKKSHCSDEHRDLIDAYLTEIEKRKGNPESTFSDDQLVMVVLDMFVAGSTTTSTTLDFIFLYLALNPRVQEKAFAEISSVIGTQLPPSLAHQSKLPYTGAVIQEANRLSSIVPIAGPRRALRDTDLEGYSIPKDTTILINLWSLHHDSGHWGDPEEFRPERFIKKEGVLESDEWLMPFGLGRRRCLGETLAKSYIFMLVAAVVQKFVISTPTFNAIPPSLPGIIASCPKHQLVFKARNS